MDPPTALPTATPIAAPTLSAAPKKETLDPLLASSVSQTLTKQTAGSSTATVVAQPTIVSETRSDADQHHSATTVSPQDPEDSFVSHAQLAQSASPTALATSDDTHSSGATSTSGAQNALSVLESAQTVASDRAVKATISGLTLTAFSGGIFAASDATLIAMQSTAAIIAGHTVTLVDGGLMVDSSTMLFSSQDPTARVSVHGEQGTAALGSSVTTRLQSNVRPPETTAIACEYLGKYTTGSAPQLGSQTQVPATPQVPAVVISLVGSTYTILSALGSLLVAGPSTQQTPQRITVAGETVLAEQSGVLIIADQSPSAILPYSALASSATKVISAATLTIDSSTHTAQHTSNPQETRRLS